ncbi:MAG: GNAT family N-acetyltransferase [Arenimonas sp.]
MPNIKTRQTVSDISAVDWNALHGSRQPFLSHAFLSGLESHQCLRERWGWQASPLTLLEGEELVAAAPAYIKSNSHGEFVFDHAWAHAFARTGRDYYPKLIVAVPYTPVFGPRLLAKDSSSRESLILAFEQKASDENLSSVHINFLPESEALTLPEYWLKRCDVQFHWQNKSGWQSFDDFLAALSHKKRKNIQQERSQVAKAGVRLRCIPGHEASDDDISAIYGFYCSTQLEKGNHPALTLEFFRYLNKTMPENVVIFLAEKNGQTIAGAYCLRSDTTLYGRYWGASENIPGLHFETCYYQGIEYCLREGLVSFEPGAQGEHKIARGFMPVITHSRHFMTERVFADALRAWCDEERQHILHYRDQVLEHSPYRHVD